MGYRIFGRTRRCASQLPLAEGGCRCSSQGRLALEEEEEEEEE